MKPILLPKIRLADAFETFENFTPWCVKSEMQDKIYIFIPVFNKVNK